MRAILTIQISEAKPLKVKNFAIWLKYDSRSGTHNVSSPLILTEIPEAEAENMIWTHAHSDL